MKQLTSLFLVIISCFCCSNISYASEKNSAAGHQIILQNGTANSNRHDNKTRLPNQKTITCYYDGEYIYLTHTYPMGKCILSIENSTYRSSIEYSSDNLYAEEYIGAIYGNINITITTESGNSYFGILEANQY
jgi:hypothetical protein